MPCRVVLEKAYVVFALVYLSSPFWGVFTVQAEAIGGSNPIELLLQAIVYATAGAFILQCWPKFVSGLFTSGPTVALIGLALLSAAWADEPLIVVRKVLLLAATTAFGIYFGSRYSREEQVDLLCVALGSITVMSLLMVALFPEYGIDPASDGPDWRGVFETKNMLGKVMVLGVISLCSSRRKWLGVGIPHFLWLAAAGGIIILSGSMTAAVTGMALLVITKLYGLLRSRSVTLVAVVMCLLATSTALIATVLEYRNMILALLGRDASLGRTPLWELVLTYIGSKPFLGYGFSSFWQGTSGPSATIARVIGWIPPHAHNGFLDLCLDLGLVGLVTFGVGFGLGAKSAIAEYRASGEKASTWRLAFLSFLILYNLTESTLLRPNNLFWALYVAALIGEVHPRLGPRSKLNDRKTYENLSF